MFSIFKTAKRFIGAAAVALSAFGSVHAAPTTQLGFLIDASGSIGAGNFQIMRQGYAAALAGLPTDGSVEVNIFTFSSGTVQVVAPTVVTAATLPGIINAVSTMAYSSGGTDTAAGINAIRAAMTASANFSAGINSIINIATDGVPNSASAAIAAATAAAQAGIDALTAEAIGSVNFDFLLDLVFSPQLPGGLPCNNCGVQLAAGATPPNPMTSLPWVLPVNSFDDFPAAIAAKVAAVTGNPIPEPGALALVAVALFAATVARRRA
jgi:hypothetical protein